MSQNEDKKTHSNSKTSVRKEIKSAVALHGVNDGGASPKADVRIVVRSLVVAGFTHSEIEYGLEKLINTGELYKPEEGKLAVV